MKRLYLLLLVVSIVAFVANLAWEYAQCGPYFIHRNLSPSHSAMLISTLGDVVLTHIGYIFIAALAGCSDWPLHRWRVQIWSAIEFVAVVEALIMEMAGLKLNRWAYTDLAPLIPGTEISVLPILQLMLLFPITFGVAAWVVRKL